jgi:hypothetical protein
MQETDTAKRDGLAMCFQAGLVGVVPEPIFGRERQADGRLPANQQYIKHSTAARLLIMPANVFANCFDRAIHDLVHMRVLEYTLQLVELVAPSSWLSRIQVEHAATAENFKHLGKAT